VSGPAGQWLAGTRPKSMWQGLPLSSVATDCRLVVLSDRRWCMERQKARLVLFHSVWQVNEVDLSVVVRYLVSGDGSEVVPLLL